MPARLLHTLTATVASRGDAERALSAARRLASSVPEGGALLLFCDFPAGDDPRDASDAALARTLLSGAAKGFGASGAPLLLLRERAWDDAARAYLGTERAETPERALASLIRTGKCASRFQAASVSPASLKGRFDALLAHDASLFCLPGMPARMLAELERSDAACATARVLPPVGRFPSALDRLLAGGFSLSAVRAAADARLAARGFAARPGEAALYGPAALARLAAGEAPQPAAHLTDCAFVRRDPATAFSLLHAQRLEARRALSCAKRGAPAGAFLAALSTLLPAAQLALLFAAAFFGFPPLCAAALVLPEYPALACPRALPGALVRAALLPASGFSALQALFDGLTARSPLLRLRVPDGAQGARGCVACGALLLMAALWSGGALVPLTPLSLLWLSAPLLFPALSAPARERIPLTEAERARLAALARDAFPLADASRSAARRMLACCAACRMGLVGPDEAARRAEALLPACFPPLSPDEAAALLCSAQLLRERMADCDAALRPLPGKIEQAAREAPLREEGPLGAWLAAALRGGAETEALALSPSDAFPGEGDALFLPEPFLAAFPARGAALPLTHPHTFLRAGLPPSSGEPAPDPALRFLALAAAAQGESFCAPLLRSPVAGPYAAALASD